jgi:hypothetical protein
MHKEIVKINKMEGSHFGHKFPIIIGSLLLIVADVILRGASSTSVVGIES